MIQCERSPPAVHLAPDNPAFRGAPGCKECAIRSAGLCRATRHKGMASAGAPPLRSYDRGKMIVQQGAFPGFLGVIRRGCARRSNLRINGKRILLGIAAPGEIVGGFPDQPSACDLEAATDLEICIYDHNTLKRLLSEIPSFRKLLLREIEIQYHRFLEGIWQYGTLDSRERIIAFLLRATEYMPTEPLPDGSLVLTMEIERRDWADLTNTAVETISRTLRYLEEKALLTSISPYRFRIHDLNRLAAIAGVEPPLRQRLGRRASNSGKPPPDLEIPRADDSRQCRAVLCN